MGYKRGQVEWALWRYFSLGGRQTPEPPTLFLTRIQRLLDVDWMRDASGSSDVPHPRYAFRDERATGKGRDVDYTWFHACCLGLGLELLDLGLKQREIVFVLRHLLGALRKEFKYIVANPPVPRMALSAKARPDCPVYENEKGVRIADCRVYWLLQKSDFPELWPQVKGRTSARHPVFLTPVFCHGAKAAGEELHKMNRDPFHYRKTFVLEIAHLVVMVRQFLEEAPVVPRGRK